jgi:hypothetical protein
VGVSLEPSRSRLVCDLGTTHNQLSGSSVEDEDNLLMHTHQHPAVFRDGKWAIVPANIRTDPNLHKDDSLDIYIPLKSPIHTHTSKGSIHVES